MNYLLKEIVAEQRLLIKWAKAYEEEGIPLVEDRIYDMQVRLLQSIERNNPKDWADINHVKFRDGSWKYTGLFYK